MQLAQDQILCLDLHVVPEIVKPQFIVGDIGYVAGIGLLTHPIIHPAGDAAHRHAQKFKHFAHPSRIAAGQIVVDRNNMDTFALKGHQIGGQGRHQGFPLTRAHFCNHPVKQNSAPNQLHIKGAKAEGPRGAFADNRKNLRHQVF